eukprot:Skav216064  [mRNA]  locus=scaffold2261:147129:147915:- [translate_table: standard]
MPGVSAQLCRASIVNANGERSREARSPGSAKELGLEGEVETNGWEAMYTATPSTFGRRVYMHELDTSVVGGCAADRWVQMFGCRCGD